MNFVNWFSVKKYLPPMQVLCLVVTDENYLYLAHLDTVHDVTVWTHETDGFVRGVTHFCIPDPVEIEE